jgi:hypothetical protein
VGVGVRLAVGALVGRGVGGGVALTGAGELVGATVGMGVAVGIGVTVGTGLTAGSGAAVVPGAAAVPGVAVGEDAAEGAGVVVTPRATVKTVAKEVVPPRVTTRTSIRCVPTVADEALQGIAYPEGLVPTKSNGAAESTWVGDPLMDGLSSQKLTLLTPREGVMKM